MPRASKISKTSARAPRANVFAERFAGTIRRERLDRLLIFGHRYFQQVIVECLSHYNQHRRTDP
jgi:hypothetical protein